MERYTVLVVDDAYENRFLLQTFLRKNDFNCITAQNGRIALEVLDKKDIDIIILDIMMPEMDGYEALERIKSQKSTKDIPVIIISAMTDIESIEKTQKLGATAYLFKPVNFKELKRIINETLRFNQMTLNYKFNKIIDLKDVIKNTDYYAEISLSGEFIYTSAGYEELELQGDDKVRSIINDFLPSLSDGKIMNNQVVYNRAGRNIVLTETFIPLLSKDQKPQRILLIGQQNKETNHDE